MVVGSRARIQWTDGFERERNGKYTHTLTSFKYEWIRFSPYKSSTSAIFCFVSSPIYPRVFVCMCVLYHYASITTFHLYIRWCVRSFTNHIRLKPTHKFNVHICVNNHSIIVVIITNVSQCTVLNCILLLLLCSALIVIELATELSLCPTSFLSPSRNPFDTQPWRQSTHGCTFSVYTITDTHTHINTHKRRHVVNDVVWMITVISCACVCLWSFSICCPPISLCPCCAG